jgi:hypothetical protein
MQSYLDLDNFIFLYAIVADTYRTDWIPLVVYLEKIVLFFCFDLSRAVYINIRSPIWIWTILYSYTE